MKPIFAVLAALALLLAGCQAYPFAPALYERPLTTPSAGCGPWQNS